MGAGIFMWQSGSNYVANNLIHHVPRKAVGGCGIRVPILQKRDTDFDEASKTIRWDEIDASIASEGTFWERYTPFLHARNNIIEYNEVYRALEELADGSALNVSGAGEGNIMRNNQEETLSLYGFARKLRPPSKSCVVLIIVLPSLLSS